MNTKNLDKTLELLERKKNRGISFMQSLTILFIALKLTDNIDWSWWLVLLPIIYKTIIAVMLLLLAVITDKLENIKSE